MHTVREIESAIDALTPQELGELYSWLDRYHPHPLDARIAADLEAGRLDAAIESALEDERNGRVRPL
jgi:hypothetical protein